MQVSLVRALWVYRGFVLASVSRDFRAKYLGSVLGGAWAVVNPLAMIAIYTLIFSGVMRARLPGTDQGFSYSIYLCAGIITWGLFSEMVGRLTNVFLENANLIKKINFPRICLPLIVTISAFLNFSIIFALFSLFLAVVGKFPGWILVSIVPVLAIQVLLALGLGIALGTLNVFFRDVGQFTGIVMQFWFWLTPIVYPADIVPDAIRAVLLYNPMFPVVQAYQAISLHNTYPVWGSLWPTAVTAVLACAVGLTLFRKHSGELVDEL